MADGYFLAICLNPVLQKTLVLRRFEANGMTAAARKAMQLTP